MPGKGKLLKEAEVNADNLISYASFVPRAVWAPREPFWPISNTNNSNNKNNSGYYYYYYY